MKRKKVMTTYLTIFKYGGCDSICSRHKTYIGAFRAAARCEERGGARHRIWKVNKMRRPRQEKP
jgi:hypothetical protein